MATGRADPAPDDPVYASYLRSMMTDCLPGALADVADRRPRDPIHTLAQYLYTYRRRVPFKPPADPELRSRYNRAGRLQQFPLRVPHSDPAGANIGSSAIGHGSSLQPGNHGVGFVEDSDQGLCDSDATSAKGILVHQEMGQVFSDIGDLFDDDEVT